MLVVRDKEETTVSVTLGERPKNFNPSGTTLPTTKPG
jgi:hypothetical protein